MRIGMMADTYKPYVSGITNYIEMCDAFITASVTEVHPLSVIEGMATGLPVLGIDSPGIGDSISDGETGLLATNNIVSITTKLTYLCMNSTLRKTMGRAAREASHNMTLNGLQKLCLGTTCVFVRAPKRSSKASTSG